MFFYISYPFRSLWFLVFLSTLLFGSAAPRVAADISGDTVLWSSPDFVISVADLKMYLNPPTTEDGEILWGTGDQVRRALDHLYTLKVLAAEARREAVLSEEQRQWIAEYHVAMKGVERLLHSRAMRMMEDVDWELAAREYYIANKEEFTTPETLDVRMLLLRTLDRTVEEAIVLARSLAPASLTREEFRVVVMENTEDPAGGDGLIENLARGQTVAEFEEAAFGLDKVDAISEPVESQFGVHVIQLLRRQPASQQSFEEARSELIQKLKENRWAEFNNYLREEPRRFPPEGLVEYQDNLDAIINLAEEQTRSSKAEATRAVIAQ
jgi:hypothetical protein